MKKLLTYILGFFACAWLVNQAVKLVLEVWQVLFLGAVLVFVGWFTFRIIKIKKDWR
jgi:Flp pilus assembly protein TadB